MVPFIIDVKASPNTHNALHPSPREEVELSATQEVNLIVQQQGTSKVLENDHTISTVQTYHWACTVVHCPVCAVVILKAKNRRVQQDIIVFIQ